MAEVLPAECPFFHPTNNVKALKEKTDINETQTHTTYCIKTIHQLVRNNFLHTNTASNKISRGSKMFFSLTQHRLTSTIILHINKPQKHMMYAVHVIHMEIKTHTHIQFPSDQTGLIPIKNLWSE